MALYTKCPACKSEIAFEPPKNIANLPEDYKHRIKCPSCGVTIGVRLNVIDRQPVRDTSLTLQPIDDSYALQPSQYDGAQTDTVPARSVDKPAKKKGTIRNIVMMLFGLLFLALGIVSYLVIKGTIGIGERSYGFEYINGVGGWETLFKHFDAFKGAFEFDTVYGIMGIMPMISFTLAFVTFIVALVSACGKKYGRAFNLIWAIIVFAVGVVVIFAPMIQTQIYISTIPESGTLTFGEYFKGLFEDKAYCIFAPMVLGLLQLVFSILFLKSLEKNREKKKKK